jgi:hypothetical protein
MRRIALFFICQCGTVVNAEQKPRTETTNRQGIATLVQKIRGMESIKSIAPARDVPQSLTEYFIGKRGQKHDWST